MNSMVFFLSFLLLALCPHVFELCLKNLLNPYIDLIYSMVISVNLLSKMTNPQSRD